MVSEERARAGNRHLQFRNEYWRGCRAACRPMDYRHIWLAVGLHRNWSLGIYLDHCLVGIVYQSAEASAYFGRGTRTHSKRSARVGDENGMARTDSPSADVGIRSG